MYVVIELQTYSDGTIGNIVQTAPTINQAQSIYHTVLAAAAISNVPVHAASLLDNEGMQIASECYHHGEIQA